MATGWEVYEGEKKGTVVEPENPSEYLKHLLEARSTEERDTERWGTLVLNRRAEIFDCFDSIESLAKELCESFIATYARHGLQIHGGVKFYVVGGTPQQKNFRESSDIDCAFTAVSETESVNVKHDGSERDMLCKMARQEFAGRGGLFDTIIKKRGLLIKETLSDGSEVEATLIEPKTYGESDVEFRNNGLDAVLVGTYAQQSHV